MVVCVGCLDDDRKIKSFYRRNDRTMRSKWVFFFKDSHAPFETIYLRTCPSDCDCIEVAYDAGVVIVTVCGLAAGSGS